MAEKIKSEDPSSGQALTLLTWNIDGLDQGNTVERASAVCEFILAKRPHVVFLQEVVPPTEVEILTKLSSDYEYFSPPFGGERYGYYVALLVRKTDELTIQKGSTNTIDLPETCMGRHVMICTVVFKGTPINLYTSHLESMKNYSQPRKVQLAKVFEMITTNSQANSIFGGDLNIRDNEVKSVGLPPNTVDVWEACGADSEHKFTWDTNENDNLGAPYKSKCRFDRVYLQSRDGRVTASSFYLVGKERLPRCRRFPSDHWGLWMEFTVQEK